MMSTKNTGAINTDAKSNDVVAADNPIAQRAKGITVLTICQAAMRSSLAIKDLRSKSTRRTDLVFGGQVAELFK